MTSVHAHNEHGKASNPGLERLRAGESSRVVSDAGHAAGLRPWRAARGRAARAAGIRVEAVPGASAALAALVCSGLPAESFTFLGFVPARAMERDAWLRAAAAEPRTVICYEAPHRVRETLGGHRPRLRRSPARRRRAS